MKLGRHVVVVGKNTVLHFQLESSNFLVVLSIIMYSNLCLLLNYRGNIFSVLVELWEFNFVSGNAHELWN